jgi:hypothetical protein
MRGLLSQVAAVRLKSSRGFRAGKIQRHDAPGFTACTSNLRVVAAESGDGLHRQSLHGVVNKVLSGYICMPASWVGRCMNVSDSWHPARCA